MCCILGQIAIVTRQKKTCKTCKSVKCLTKNGKEEVEFEWIECDACKSWYHGICQGLKPEQVVTITDLNDKRVQWYCDNCFPRIAKQYSLLIESTTIDKLSSLEQVARSIENKIDELKEKNVEVKNQLKTSWAEIATQNQNKGELAKEVRRAVAITSGTQAMISKEMEKKDNEGRALNAILYGLPEQNCPVLDQVEELMKKDFYKNHSKPTEAIRLGRKQEDKTRPIKVSFKNETDKWEFLKRTNSSLRPDNIFCKLDLCKQSREKEYVLREQIRALKRDEGNANIEYRVRNQHIQHRKKGSGEGWELTPARQTNTTF